MLGRHASPSTSQAVRAPTMRGLKLGVGRNYPLFPDNPKCKWLTSDTLGATYKGTVTQTPDN